MLRDEYTLLFTNVKLFWVSRVTVCCTAFSAPRRRKLATKDTKDTKGEGEGALRVVGASNGGVSASVGTVLTEIKKRKQEVLAAAVQAA
jgi:hypothetical protein